MLFMHTNLHIEKCGGTSVLKVLEQNYGPTHVLVYDGITGTFSRSSDRGISSTNTLLHSIKRSFGESPLLPLIYQFYLKICKAREKGEKPRYEIADLPSDTRAITGHFTMDILNEGPEKLTDFTSLVLRDPLERMISQYRHWFRNGGSNGWRLDLPFDPELSFAEYAFRPEFQNHQSVAMGDWRLEDFDVVGVTNYMDCYISSISSRDQITAPVLNASPSKPNLLELGITEEVIELFRDFNSEDYENYEQATRLVCPY